MGSPNNTLPLIGSPHGQCLTEEERRRKWDFLSSAISRFSTDDVKTLSFEELYRTAYDLVLRGEGDFLYAQVQKCLGDACLRIVEVLNTVPDENWLEFAKLYEKEFNKYRKMVAHLGDVLLYMERRYCQYLQKPTVSVLAGIELRLKVFEQSDVGKRASRVVCHCINEIRKTDDLDLAKLSLPLSEISTIVTSTMMYDSSVTKFAFHRLFIGDPLLAESEKWFMNDVTKILQCLNGMALLNHITTRVENEAAILQCAGINEKSIRNKMQKLIIKLYVENIADRLLQNPEISVQAIFCARDLKTAKKLYETLKQSPLVFSQMVNLFTEQLHKEGVNILREKKGKEAIQQLTKLRSDATIFIGEAFRDDVAMKRSIRKALEKLSSYKQLLPRTLATAIHECLQELEAESQLPTSEAVAKLTAYVDAEFFEPFRALRDKDAFEFHYRNDLMSRFLGLLAKRFIDDTEGLDPWGRDAMEIENRMLQILLTECGNAYTQRSQGFLEDVRQSKKYQLQITSDDGFSPGDELQTIVLSSSRSVKEIGTIEKIAFDAVPEMSHWKQAFEVKYQNALHNRRLVWHPQFGRALVRFTPSRHITVDIMCSTCQAMYLLLFDFHLKLKWGEIKSLLNITNDSTGYYLRHFLGLVVHKEAKFLSFVNGGRPRIVEDEDEFIANMDFSSFKRRIVARVVSARTKGLSSSCEQMESQEEFTLAESAENNDVGIAKGLTGLPLCVEQNRNTIVDAAIVRIMKAKRKLNHIELVTHLTDVLKTQFQPSGSLVKERVAYLIDREFLQRDANHQ